MLPGIIVGSYDFVVVVVVFKLPADCQIYCTHSLYRLLGLGHPRGLGGAAHTVGATAAAMGPGARRERGERSGAHSEGHRRRHGAWGTSAGPWGGMASGRGKGGGCIYINIPCSKG